MPRNGSGTFSITYTYSAGQTITAAIINANFADVGAELTNSLPRDGQAAMTGALKLADGTVALPGLSFNTDTDCGWYRIGANNIGFSIGGVKLLDLGAATFGITGALTVSGAVTLASGVIAGSALADNGVTYAKMQDVSATSRILGRKTASSGDTEECTLSEVLDFVGSAAQGDVLYRSSSGWTRLAAGTTGKMLQTRSTGNDPQWAFPGKVLIQTQTASASSTLDFTTGLDDTYDAFLIELSNIVPGTDDSQLQMLVGTGGGPTYQTSSYQWSATQHIAGAVGNIGGSAQAFMGLTTSSSTDAVGSASGEHYSGTVSFDNPEATIYPIFRFQGAYIRAASNNVVSVVGCGCYFSSTAITGIRFKFSAGTIASGRISLYGLGKS